MPPTLSLLDLRRLVETVAGSPDATVDVFEDGTTISATAARGGGASVLFSVAPSQPAGSNTKPITIESSPPVVLLHPDGTPVPNVLKECDCAAWSIAAFEKFFVPYYTRLMTGAELEQYRRVMADRDVLCALHLPRSVGLIGTKTPAFAVTGALRDRMIARSGLSIQGFGDTPLVFGGDAIVAALMTLDR
ncbi:MAG: hypothetical protein IT355_16390 [Gemmatimonadaceae bacterium]|nr:hypothetical protein [Gemmatimonadaceae bacterium]